MQTVLWGLKDLLEINTPTCLEQAKLGSEHTRIRSARCILVYILEWAETVLEAVRLGHRAESFAASLIGFCDQRKAGSKFRELTQALILPPRCCI